MYTALIIVNCTAHAKVINPEIMTLLCAFMIEICLEITAGKSRLEMWESMQKLLKEPFMKFQFAFYVFLLLAFPSALLASVDTFGIRQIYPTKAGTHTWNSVHWANGIARTVKYASDPYDPTDWTEDHSGGTDGFYIDGNGVMLMSGSGPRFHINSLRTTKSVQQFFCDIEFTAYYKRLGSAGQNYGGMVVGVRSDPLGHASAGGDNCNATTYYARFRNDGKWDFEKELKHSGSTYWSGSGYNKQDPLWGGAKLPLNRWIGMKYVVHNVSNNSAVKLELYIDSVSNGEPVNGGNWELVGTITDSGSWPSGDVSGCGYDESAIILEGHGTVLMRTDGDTAVYKKVTVREIDPQTSDVFIKTEFNSRNNLRTGSTHAIAVNGVISKHSKSNLQNVNYQQYTLQGKIVNKHIKTDPNTLQVLILSPDRVTQ